MKNEWNLETIFIIIFTILIFICICLLVYYIFFCVENIYEYETIIEEQNKHKIHTLNEITDEYDIFGRKIPKQYNNKRIKVFTGGKKIGKSLNVAKKSKDPTCILFPKYEKREIYNSFKEAINIDNITYFHDGRNIFAYTDTSDIKINIEENILNFTELNKLIYVLTDNMKFFIFNPSTNNIIEKTVSVQFNKIISDGEFMWGYNSNCLYQISTDFRIQNKIKIKDVAQNDVIINNFDFYDSNIFIFSDSSITVINVKTLLLFTFNHYGITSLVYLKSKLYYIKNKKLFVTDLNFRKIEEINLEGFNISNKLVTNGVKVYVNAEKNEKKVILMIENSKIYEQIEIEEINYLSCSNNFLIEIGNKYINKFLINCSY